MGLSEKIIIKEETYLLLLILTVCVIDTIYLLENVVCFNSIVLPCRFGILKVTLNVDLSLGGLKTWCNIMRSKNGLNIDTLGICYLGSGCIIYPEIRSGHKKPGSTRFQRLHNNFYYAYYSHQDNFKILRSAPHKNSYM